MTTSPALSDHQRAQLKLLREARAVTRSKAVSTVGRHDLNPGTLTKLVGLGLVENANLPFHGDTKRRLSHYWLTAVGVKAADPRNLTPA